MNLLLPKGRKQKRRLNRVRDEKHLAFIRRLPCICCADDTSVEAAHIRATSRDHGKVNPGIGRKPDDRWTLPLCGKHHRQQHADRELAFWAKFNIDPFALATALWIHTGDEEKAQEIIRGAR
jgi:hypothetical protein